MRVDDAWWHGEEVWYQRGAMTQVASRKVKSIEPVFVAQVETKAKTGTPPPTLPAEKPARSFHLNLDLPGWRREVQSG